MTNKVKKSKKPSFWLALALYRMVQGPESPSHRHPDENQDHSSEDSESSSE